ncbi:MAG: O-antigen ligase family protein, partial [Actinomycetota bacterium]|nr:O-antigen ligase family protein [Actinomycetota bacterium]
KWGMATVVVPAVLIVALVISGWSAVSSIAEPRATLASPDRSGEVRAALDVARDNLLFGAGPGGATLAWPSRDGGTLVARYAHNEYLQMLAELGVAGLVLVAGLIAALALMVWRGRSSAPSPELWAGVVAGLTALAFHSAFDFLWHIPVIPIVAVVLAGLTLETTGEEAL